MSEPRPQFECPQCHTAIPQETFPRSAVCPVCGAGVSPPDSGTAPTTDLRWKPLDTDNPAHAPRPTLGNSFGIVLKRLAPSPQRPGKCPYCGVAVDRRESVRRCPSCGIPHHTACWQENGTCAVLGCSGESPPIVTPRPGVQVPPERVLIEQDTAPDAAPDLWEVATPRDCVAARHAINLAVCGLLLAPLGVGIVLGFLALLQSAKARRVVARGGRFRKARSRVVLAQTLGIIAMVLSSLVLAAVFLSRF